ncbi:hypothetical protein SSPSH_000265 [Salinisphaera shabanensis E1L3A]|uniref:Uncharacterized protein n=1 Tax=Salinisphaera shabanensis E1L3A TaxID=1033802 RepID=U2G4A7_9GAMM|nr:hypothetical protein SSPSH_000265 [Salinisphaera shabanensis E1L3A]
MDIVSTTITSVLTGVLTGLYSSLIITRFGRFVALRDEALRLVRSAVYIAEESKLNFPQQPEYKRMVLISSDFFALKHSKAANEINDLHGEIYKATLEAQSGQLDFKAYDHAYTEWQRRIRMLRPNYRSLITLYPRL